MMKTTQIETQNTVREIRSARPIALTLSVAAVASQITARACSAMIRAQKAGVAGLDGRWSLVSDAARDGRYADQIDAARDLVAYCSVARQLLDA